MKFKKGGRSRSFGAPTPNKDKVIIAGEAYEAPEITAFICNYCSRDLIKLSDSSGNNVSWYCNHCSIPFEPEKESIRHKQRLEVPDRNVEPAVTSIGMTPDVSIRHEPELKGGFAQMAKKGTIRFTSYQESNP
jgi:hypothetical protein